MESPKRLKAARFDEETTQLQWNQGIIAEPD